MNDILDYFADNKDFWRLDATDIKKVMALRVDFSVKAVTQLRFG
jgi:hypothetical protein